MVRNVSGAGKKGPLLKFSPAIQRLVNPKCGCTTSTPTTPITTPSSAIQLIGTFRQNDASLGNYDIVYNAATDTWMVVGTRRANNTAFKTSGAITSASVWTPCLNSSTTTTFGLTAVPNTSTWLACGTDTSILRSIDNGNTWNTENIDIVTPLNLYSIASNLNQTKGIAVGNKVSTQTAVMYVYDVATTSWSASGNIPPNLVSLTRVVYSEVVDRWFIVGSTSTSNAIFVSATNDPAGSWNVIPSGGAYSGMPLRDVKIFNGIVNSKLMFSGNFDGNSSFYTSSFTDVNSLNSLSLSPFATGIFNNSSHNAYAFSQFPITNGVGFVAGGNIISNAYNLYVNKNGDGTTWIPCLTPNSSQTFVVRNLFCGVNNWMAVGDDSSGGARDCIYVGTYA